MKYITLEVKLFATLGEKNFRSKTMELPQEIRVEEVIDLLEIPREEVALIFVNGIHADMDRKLEDGNRLALFPPVGGG